ncbi:hypothetical protein FJT64_006636 [Amphibalanus amphitrite]|uniref:Uncharacterized protein n=1 Tax=Amphibalanus amphitrite TaxID=1232801 RepID=A0A6A4VP15_AMPAM|nr:hypothetical protein FJT64_006636 [Amphibalanus amphitrite]
MAQPVQNSVWAELCFAQVYTDLQVQELNAALAGVSDLVCKVAYEGFSAKVIRETMVQLADQQNRNLLSDLVSPLTLFHARGANTKKLGNEATGRYQDDTVATEMHRLITAYKIVEKPNCSRKAVTLPRISLSFPNVSLRVTCELIINDDAPFLF